ncbi:MAG TPA: hypothetical protein PLC81_01980 [Bacteroidales bacterium]|jgi:hypothetical protein|nr:hypothetical protein [Bacteroidales bacterium]HQK36379.1 hypothetical protein [Bacteroidales bacterium]
MNLTFLNEEFGTSPSHMVMPAKCYLCKWNDREEWDDQNTVCPYLPFALGQDDLNCLYFEPVA